MSLGLTYRLIRERDGVVIGEGSVSLDTTDSNENRSNLQSGLTMAVNAVPSKLRDFNKELVPWTSTEKLVLDKETSKDKVLKKRMKEAEATDYSAAQAAAKLAVPAAAAFDALSRMDNAFDKAAAGGPSPVGD